jgi:hypothetical protein
MEGLMDQRDQEMTKDCTFMPEISDNSRKIVNRMYEYEPIHKRYQQEAVVKEKKLKEAQK